MPFSYASNQEGTLRAQDYMMMAQSAAFNTATLTHGTFANKRFGGLSGIGRYMSGLNQDVMTARKIAGVTFPSRKYAQYVAGRPRLQSFAPTLSHLLPSKYLSYWSALAGNADALQSMASMAIIKDINKMNVGRLAGGATDDIWHLAGGKDLPAYKYSKAMRTQIFDSQISRLSDVKWGQIVGQDSFMMGMFRSKQAAVLDGTAEGARVGAAKWMATRAGINEGKLGGTISGFLARKVAGEQSTAWITMGRAIKPASRLLGTATAGVDLFSIGMFAGSMLGKGMLASLAAPGKMYSTMTQGIHRGTFMSSSPISPFVGQTGRQRAMANIYDRQLNLRQAMGNEAAILAGM